MQQDDLPGISASVGLLMLFQVSALLVREFVRLKLNESGVDPASAKQLSALAGFLLLAILIWPLLRGNLPNLRRLYAAPRSWTRLILVSVSIGLLLRIATWGKSVTLIAAGLHAQTAGIAPRAADFWWQCASPSYLALSFIVMALLTPAVEETISRGMIFTTLLNRGKTSAVLVSAALFAILHTPENIPFAFLFGIAAAVQLMHCRTLWGPLIAHGTFNGLINLDQDCLHWLWVPAVSSIPITIVSAALTVLLVAVAYLLARYRGAG